MDSSTTETIVLVGLELELDQYKPRKMKMFLNRSISLRLFPYHIPSTSISSSRHPHPLPSFLSHPSHSYSCHISTNFLRFLCDSIQFNSIDLALLFFDLLLSWLSLSSIELPSTVSIWARRSRRTRTILTIHIQSTGEHPIRTSRRKRTKRKYTERNTREQSSSSSRNREKDSNTG